ncbi:hypothetical protein ORI89_00705 [Sphingobacterium sp. UT-1RO-CII-1]|uniref:DUF7935 family protein n=1 Tax=Sphingobacterium sp. UT-1RO-CII-1 TaxID=2995225 RepID=UPI00227B2164|nr:hypothetical protein [Sphingobacterium sp. UT-1RO-CII-1]MCY4778152.1 hypothetical protein [Sphingobacterium sp. UT-1RO-CII-1]
MSKEYIDFFLMLGAVTLGMLLGGLLLFKIIWPKVESYILRLNALNQTRASTKELQRLKWNAYERMLLWTHRVEPKQVMLRKHNTSINVQQFKQLLIQDVEDEFQHNLTQQLYISDIAWQYISDLKNNTILLFKNVEEGLNETADVDHFVAAVLEHMSELQENPYLSVRNILKKELNY